MTSQAEQTKFLMPRILALVAAMRAYDSSLTFTVLDVGAAPLSDEPEPFYSLLDWFPGSSIHAFELDTALCAEKNRNAPPGLTFHAQALGRADEQRTLYETQAPMCTSLYKPNAELNSLYHQLEVTTLEKTSTVHTISLDQFVAEHKIGAVDFLKIDIQGAECDVFQGAPQTLSALLMTVTEVEFIPLYENQPLFGDVSQALHQYNLMLHKFLGMAGRSLRPFMLNKDPLFMSQVMWADALFMRTIQHFPLLSSAELNKLAILSLLYGSVDVALYCTRLHDEKFQTSFLNTLVSG